MKSRRYNKRIVPVRKFVSSNSGIKIINGKPRNFKNVEEKRSKLDFTKIKNAKIMVDGDDIESCAGVKNITKGKECCIANSKHIVAPRSPHTVFIITMDDDTRLRQIVQTGSRNYYCLLQYLKTRY